MRDYETGFGLDTWIYSTDFKLQVIYSAIVNIQNSQFTAAPAKPFPACCVFTGVSQQRLLTVEILQLLRTQVLPSPILVQNCLSAIPSTELESHLLSASFAQLSCTEHYLAPRLAAISQPAFQLSTANSESESVCLLYMLMALASAVFLGSEFLGTRDLILLSQI
jgi:hypothetical protein